MFTGQSHTALEFKGIYLGNCFNCKRSAANTSAAGVQCYVTDSSAVSKNNFVRKVQEPLGQPHWHQTNINVPR